ncbi:MAG: MFS transporter, partial [Candidatus Dormibacteria bacterium]
LALIRTPLPAPEPESERDVVQELREGLNWTWHHPFIRSTALLTVGSDFVINGLFLLLLVLVRERGASPTLVGVMLALGSAGGLLGAIATPWLAKRAKSLRLVIVGVLWVDTVLVVMLVVTTSPIALGCLLGLILFLWPLRSSMVQARWTMEIPDRLMGRVRSVTALLGWAPVPLAPLVAGILLATTGRVVAILCFAGIMLSVALAATFNRHVKQASLDSCDLSESAGS